jgi:hypothetical protein
MTVHGEHEHRRPLIVQAKPADEGEATKSPGAHGEVDDDDVGPLHAIEAKSVGQSLRLHDVVDSGILEQLSAALQHDGMIVDDEDPGHDMPPTSSSARARSVFSRCTGISMRMVVPLSRGLSTTHVPRGDFTLSAMVVRPNPFGVPGVAAAIQL